MQIVISPSGSMRCVYDEMLNLTALGQVRIERGSHVEPDGKGKWWADLGPVKGPRLGPYEKRSQALGAERDWLEGIWLWYSSP